MASITIESTIGTEDINFATGGTGAPETFDRRTSTGGILTQEKIDASHLKYRGSAYSVENSATSQYPCTNRAGIDAAITAIGSNAATINLLPGSIPISTDLTIPANITLKPERGAIFAVATTKTLTINGPFDVGLYQVFSCTGTGKVVFGAGSVKEVYPEWWGAVPDDSTASGPAINAALASGAKVVSAQNGTYRTSVPLIKTGGVCFQGQGRGTVIKKITNTTSGLAAVAAPGGSPATDILNVDAIVIIPHDASAWSYYDSIKDMWLTGAGASTVAYGIYAPRTNALTVSNVVMDTVTNGLYSLDAISARITHSKVQDCEYGFNFDLDASGYAGATLSLLENCWVTNNTKAAYRLRKLYYSNIISCGCDLADHTTSLYTSAIWQFDNCRSLNVLGCGTEAAKATLFDFTDMCTVNIDGFQNVSMADCNYGATRYLITLQDCASTGGNATQVTITNSMLGYSAAPLANLKGVYIGNNCTFQTNLASLPVGSADDTPALGTGTNIQGFSFGTLTIPTVYSSYVQADGSFLINAYLSGGNYKYTANGGAFRITKDSFYTYLQTGPVGVKDATITWNSAVKIDLISGKLRLEDRATFAPLAAAPTGASLIQGDMCLADRVNWDPLSKGSGGPYFVWYNGSSWVAIDSQ